MKKIIMIYIFFYKFRKYTFYYRVNLPITYPTQSTLITIY